MSAPSKTGPALIYMLRDDAMDLLAKLGATREELVLRMLAMALNVGRVRVPRAKRSNRASCS